MADVFGDVVGFIAPLKTANPSLHRALQLLNQQLHKVTTDLEPLIEVSTLPVGPSVGPAPPAINYEFLPLSIRFSWNLVSGAALYEVRMGSVWDSASLLFRTVNSQADIDPLPSGTYQILIKTISSDGNYSTTTMSLIFTVPTIPAVVLTGQVIDNNVLLFWEPPTSVFQIDYYEIFKDGVSLGTTQGTFATRFEAASATYTYRVVAVDVAGNISADAFVALKINQPPDYVLQSTFHSTLTGTGTNVSIDLTTDPVELVGPVDGSRTWAQHFTDNGWTTIDDQIAAGFPIYAQPSLHGGTPDGSYLEQIDFGSIFASTIVTVTFNFNQLMLGHDVVVVVKMSWSPDNITYTSYTSGASQFAANIRYLRFKLELTTADTKALIEIFNVIVSLQVKREEDGGSITAVSTDVGGTSVLFNKTFHDIDSITATPRSALEPYAVIINFTDIPDPLGFSVLVYDHSGNRVTKLLDWKARGIV